MKLLMSIKPVFADKIIDGNKLYEYRRIIPKQTVTGVIVYSSSPVQRVIGEFQIEDIVSGGLAEVWEKTKHHSGIIEEFYLRYFANKPVANAIKVASAKRYRRPINPYEIIPGFRAPQSFSYMDETIYSLLMNDTI